MTHKGENNAKVQTRQGWLGSFGPPTRLYVNEHTTKLHPLRANIAAAASELTDGDLHEIANAAAQITVQGGDV